MTDVGLLASAEELFEDAPCGYLALRPDGTVALLNRTFERWTGVAREAVVGRSRFGDLLAPGSRIYHETHVAPLLAMQGEVRGIALELRREGREPLPVMLAAALRGEGAARVVRVTLFDATDRRSYERELLELRRRERDVAVRLQRSLLSGRRPEAPGLDLDVVYRPAATGLEIGGDWHDAFWVQEGDRVAFVVGDVVGRGLEAAATMGQLRSATRALAGTGMGPAGVLTGLDRYAERHEVGRMATVVVAELDLGSGVLRWACAGHPPPVVALPGEAAALRWEGRSPPLDSAAATGRPREEGELVLPPGGAVVLYTDGLVERRDVPLDEALDALAAAVGRRAGASADELASQLVREVAPAERGDDLCLLAARRVE